MSQMLSRNRVSDFSKLKAVFDVSGQRNCALFAVVSFLTMVAGSAEGQNAGVAELVTDRPDFTESGVVVPKGSFQVEGGFTWESGAGAVQTASGPELLVRWGLTSRMELRFGLPDYVGVWNGQTESGFGDPSIGTKLQLGPIAQGWDLATVITVSMPTGETGFSSDGWDPSVILTTGGGIGGSWSLGTQVFGELATNVADREFNWGGTLVLGRSLGTQGTTGSFLELAAIVPAEGDVSVSLHHGYIHLLTKTLQLDVHGGVGLTDTAPDVFFGAGMTIRR